MPQTGAQIPTKALLDDPDSGMQIFLMRYAAKAPAGRGWGDVGRPLLGGEPRRADRTGSSAV